MFQMLTKYNQDSSVKIMVDKMDWVIMPSLNPDGYKYTWNGVSSEMFLNLGQTRKHCYKIGKICKTFSHEFHLTCSKMTCDHKNFTCDYMNFTCDYINFTCNYMSFTCDYMNFTRVYINFTYDYMNFTYDYMNLTCDYMNFTCDYMNFTSVYMNFTCDT